MYISEQKETPSQILYWNTWREQQMRDCLKVLLRLVKRVRKKAVNQSQKWGEDTGVRAREFDSELLEFWIISWQKSMHTGRDGNDRI